MFNKLKQFKDLRDQAKTIQEALSEETTVVEKHGIKIEMDGNMKVKSVSIEKEMDKEKMEKAMVEAMNEAIKKTQRAMAMKMQQMGGFPGMN